LFFFDPLRGKSLVVEGATEGAEKDKFTSESMIELLYETLKRENNKKKKQKVWWCEVLCMVSVKVSILLADTNTDTNT
jgi:hypothetical protein